MRNIHGWLSQHAHALIMKRAIRNVTLGFGGHTAVHALAKPSRIRTSSAEALRPPTSTTVGDPLPVHFKYILRSLPISTKASEVIAFFSMCDRHTERVNEGNSNEQQKAQ
jgi:hypothetical protein